MSSDHVSARGTTASCGMSPRPSVKARLALGSAVIDLCYAMAANLTMAEATQRFEAERVPFAMILSPEEITRDPHAVAIGLFEEFDHPVTGRTRLPRHPARFATTPAVLGGPSPSITPFVCRR